MKRLYGDEYPAAVTYDGERLPLAREGRWIRIYEAEGGQMSSVISRFMDGSAMMSFEQLVSEWPTWSEGQRVEFCHASDFLGDQEDFPSMLRYIMDNGGPDEWSCVALSVAAKLPKHEAFERLTLALRSVELGRCSNLGQGIAKTKHRQAQAVLRQLLDDLWAHPALWSPVEWSNRIAFDATTDIAHLIELGVSPEEFADRVRRLADHECERNRDSCRNFLSKHYGWLQ